MKVVVATTPDGVGGTRARLRQLGASTHDVLAPSDGRRLVLASVDDDWDAQRIVTVLQADDVIAVARPDGGARLDAWMHHTRPLTFGARLSVSFAWSEHDRRHLPGPIELGLGGFGNGEHPSTSLVIDELTRRISGGERVVDVGCGSGVLGLCALELGAAHVTAVDVKPEAVAATRRNAALNDVAARLHATLAPLTEIDHPRDVVVANLGLAAVVELAPHLVRLVAETGWLAVSGFSPAQSTQVTDFLRPLVEIDRRGCGEWSVVVLAHQKGARR